MPCRRHEKTCEKDQRKWRRQRPIQAHRKVGLSLLRGVDIAEYYRCVFPDLGQAEGGRS
jgi:hypothetical protein